MKIINFKFKMLVSLSLILCFLLSQPVLASVQPMRLLKAGNNYYSTNFKDVCSPVFPYPIYNNVIEHDYHFFSNKPQAVKVLTSDPKIATVTTRKYQGMPYYRVKLNGKIGTVSFISNKKVAAKIQVEKYINPCSSLKIGSKDFTKQLSSKPYIELKMKKKQNVKGKLNIRPASGWSLNNVYTVSYNTKSGRTTEKKAKIKNGSTISINGYDNGREMINTANCVLLAVFKNNKTKQYYTICIDGGKM